MTAKATGGGPEPLQERLGRYDLISRIGVGGMAEVYLARQRGMMKFEKLVVVKTIHTHLAAHPKFIEMLLEEARISALIKHPHVVDIYDLGKSGDTYFIAMEYLLGQPLTAVITAGVRRGDPLSPDAIASIVREAADGLHAAHDLTTMSGEHLGLIHRDVSPGNIVVQYSGSVKLVDFGVALARNSLDGLDAGELKGKTGYTAPELFDGAVPDRRTDIFGLGVVMWECLAQRRLFRAGSEADTIAMIRAGNVPPPSKHRPNTPPELDRIALKALAHRADDRYQTAQAMQRDLERYLTEAHFYRDGKIIKAWMQRAFADKMAEQRQLVRRATGGQAPAAASDADVIVVDLDEDAELAVGDQTSLHRAPPSAMEDEVDDEAPTMIANLDELDVVVAAHEAPSSPERTPAPAMDLPLPAPTTIDEPLSPELVARLRARSEPAPAARSEPPPGEQEPADTVAEHPLDHDILAPTPTPSGVVEPRVTGSQVSLAPRRTPLYVGIGIAAVAAVLAVVLVASGGDATDDAPAQAATAPPATGTSAPPAALESPATRADPTPDPGALPTPVPGDVPLDESIAANFTRTGDALFAKGKLEDAQTAYQEALKSFSEYPPAYRGLGFVYAELGDRKTALWALQKYLDLDPRADDTAAIERRIAALGRDGE